MKKQTTRYFEVDEAYTEEIFESAKEYGVTATYSDGDLKLEGAVGDVKDVIFDKFELYDDSEFEDERNRTQPIRSVLESSEPNEAELEPKENSRSEKRFGYLLEQSDSANQGSKKLAVADGGEEMQTMAHVDHETDVKGPQRSME